MLHVNQPCTRYTYRLRDLLFHGGQPKVTVVLVAQILSLNIPRHCLRPHIVGPVRHDDADQQFQLIANYLAISPSHPALVCCSLSSMFVALEVARAVQLERPPSLRLLLDARRHHVSSAQAVRALRPGRRQHIRQVLLTLLLVDAQSLSSQFGELSERSGDRVMILAAVQTEADGQRLRARRPFVIDKDDQPLRCIRALNVSKMTHVRVPVVLPQHLDVARERLVLALLLRHLQLQDANLAARAQGVALRLAHGQICLHLRQGLGLFVRLLCRVRALLFEFSCPGQARRARLALLLRPTDHEFFEFSVHGRQVLVQRRQVLVLSGRPWRALLGCANARALLGRAIARTARCSARLFPGWGRAAVSGGKEVDDAVALSFAFGLLLMRIG